jgi:hypothetical protein
MRGTDKAESGATGMMDRLVVNDGEVSLGRGVPVGGARDTATEEGFESALGLSTFTMKKRLTPMRLAPRAPTESPNNTLLRLGVSGGNSVL